MHHFIAISEIKLKLQSGNPKFGSNSMILVPCDLEIWQVTTKIIGLLFYAMSSSVHHSVVISEFKLELQSGNAQFGSKSSIFVTPDLEIWRMTLKNNRAPFLCHFKPCASFHYHMWIQTGVTVRKRQNWVFFLCDLDLWPLTLSFCMGIASPIVSIPRTTVVFTLPYLGAPMFLKQCPIPWNKFV